MSITFIEKMKPPVAVMSWEGVRNGCLMGFFLALVFRAVMAAVL